MQNDVLVLVVQGALLRCDGIEMVTAPILLVYRKSSGSSFDRVFTVVIFRCTASKVSHEELSNFSRRASHASYPFPTPSSRVFPSNLRTTEKAGPDVVK